MLKFFENYSIYYEYLHLFKIIYFLTIVEINYYVIKICISITDSK